MVFRFVTLGSRVIACTGGGAFASKDEGQTWSRLDSPWKLHDVHNIREIYGRLFAATAHGLFISNDSGTTWDSLTTSSPRPYNVNDVIDHRGWLYAASYLGSVLRSADSGRTWENVKGTSTQFGQIFFQQDSVLLLGSSTSIERTTDGGTTWKSIRPSNSSRTNEFVKTNHGLYAAMGGGVFRSTDVGATWTPLGLNDVASLTVDANGTFYATGYDGYGTHTRSRTDSTWRQLVIAPGRAYGSAIVATANAILVSPYKEGVYRSVDGGKSWKEIPKAIAAVNVYRMSASHGKIFATSDYNGLHTSTDHGETWKNMLPDQSIFGVDTRDSVVILGLSNDAHVWVSTDAGSSFANTSDWPGNCCISGVWCVNTDLYFSQDRRTARSTDQGRTWGGADSGLPDAYVYSMSGNETSAYAATITSYRNTYGGVYQSRDSGQHWKRLNIGTTADDDVWFVLAFGDTVLAATSRGLYRSTNDGEIWARVYIPNLRSIVRSGNVLFAAPTFNGFCSSTDGGATWVNHPLDPIGTISSICVEGGYLFLGLEEGSVKRFPLDTVLTSIAPERQRRQGVLSIYPNPTNGKQEVTITGSFEQGTVLSVLDAWGRVMSEHMVEESGTSFTMPISMAASGMYVCVARTSSGIMSAGFVVMH
ncbi:MAG: T9SS type A sorting domain-containing protein [Bacteroidetes bacterium]|nr:T9SS type A sorting domain-containing protein [Bacteroidota bacterium]